MGDVRAEAHRAGSAWGDTVQSFGVANQTTKKFGGRWLIILHTTINQKQMPGMGESMERMCNRVVDTGKVQ
jgi:hypothetical protein